MSNNGLSRLIDIKQGEAVRITSFDGKPSHMLKLQKFGLYPGDIARVIRRAPFGGPLLLHVRGMEIALGASLATHIMVEPPE